VDYTPLNMNGHYKLDLSKSLERKIAEELYLNNQRIAKIIDKNKLFDMSKTGNKSCFRNETLHFLPMQFIPGFTFPKDGVFECDFTYLYQSRGQSPISEQQFGILYQKLQSSTVPLQLRLHVLIFLSYILLIFSYLRQYRNTYGLLRSSSRK